MPPAPASNPPLPERFRIFTLMALAVAVLGLTLLVAPGLMRPNWPWEMRLFETRFTGAMYVPVAAVLIFLAMTNRWSPGRVAIWMGFVFGAVAIAVTAVYAGRRFDFSGPAAWLWFITYVSTAAVLGRNLWINRNTPPVGGPPQSGWRLFFLAQAAVLFLYALALLAFPDAATAFWPYRGDILGTQLYSSVFFAAAIGAWLLARRATRAEAVAYGLGAAGLGAGLIIAEIVAADAIRSAGADWTLPDGGILRWTWTVGTAALVVVGLASMTFRPRRSEALASPSLS
jgi:hypothetical protein